MQRRLNFQIQRIQSREAIPQLELLLHCLNAQARTGSMKLSVDFHPEDDYCNVSVESGKATKLWKRFCAFAAENPREFDWISKRWIVVLQGESGWDDYLLLAHFDSSVQLDTAK
jgi:hypothetical protein